MPRTWPGNPLDRDGILAGSENLAAQIRQVVANAPAPHSSRGASVAYRATRPKICGIRERYRNQVSSEGVLEVSVSAPP